MFWFLFIYFYVLIFRLRKRGCLSTWVDQSSLFSSLLETPTEIVTDNKSEFFLKGMLIEHRWP